MVRKIDQHNKMINRFLFFAGPVLAAIFALLVFIGLQLPDSLYWGMLSSSLLLTCCYVVRGWLQFFKKPKN